MECNGELLANGDCNGDLAANGDLAIIKFEARYYLRLFPGEGGGSSRILFTLISCSLSK